MEAIITYRRGGKILTLDQARLDKIVQGDYDV
jgi:hypothetical protein